MDAKAQIKQFILETIVAESGLSVSDFDDDESLIDSGILDSLGMLKLIAFLDEEMDTNIMAESFSLEDFATLDLIYGWVERHGSGAGAGAAASGAPAAPSGAAGAGASRAAPSPAAAAPQTPSAASTPGLAPTTPMPGLAELRNAAVDSGLTGRVVLVTGASRGLGETIAKLFSLYGARVAVNFATNEGHARRVAAEIEAGGGEAMVVGANVADPAAVDAMVEQVTGRWGRLDVLVNNAAADATPIEFGKVTWNEVEASIDVIARGAFNCCKAVIPKMLAQGGGKIVNVGTLATDNPAPNQLKYVMAKSALVGLTRSLAVDFAGRNIQINLVSPSVVETDLIGHIPEAYRGRIAENTPMQRNATPTDVAQAVVYLASAHAGFTTGQKLMVTGGAAPFL